MLIKYTGKDKVSKRKIKYLEDLLNYTCEKFFTQRLRDKLEFNIIFKKNLLKKEGVLADCIWEDQHYRPREFTIRFEQDQPTRTLVNSMAHELVHVKQWAKGEMWQVQTKKRTHRYNSKEYNCAKMDYWEYPWEIEAHGRAIGIVNMWVRDRQFSAKICDEFCSLG